MTLFTVYFNLNFMSNECSTYQTFWNASLTFYRFSDHIDINVENALKTWIF